MSVDLRAPDLQLTGSANAGIGAGDSLSANGRWEPTDLAALSRRLGVTPPFPLTGSGSMRFEVSGSRDRIEALHVAADLDRLNLDVDGEAVRLAQPDHVEYDGRNLGVATPTWRWAIRTSRSRAHRRCRVGGTRRDAQGSAADFEFLQHFARAAGEPRRLAAAAGVIAPASMRPARFRRRSSRDRFRSATGASRSRRRRR